VRYIDDVNAFLASAHRPTNQKHSPQGRHVKNTTIKKKDGPSIDHSQRHTPKFDAELIADLVAPSSVLADRGEGILVFLPGIQAIRRVNSALRRRQVVKLNANILILHSMVLSHVGKQQLNFLHKVINISSFVR
jgi:HrpA-like RNA helicase